MVKRHSDEDQPERNGKSDTNHTHSTYAASSHSHAASSRQK
jgi:hypothetical protein